MIFLVFSGTLGVKSIVRKQMDVGMGTLEPNSRERTVVVREIE